MSRKRKPVLGPSRCPECGRQWLDPTDVICGMCEVFSGKRVSLLPLAREIQKPGADFAETPALPITSLIPQAFGKVSRS